MEIYEQLDLFSYMQPQTEKIYCFDDDVNEIHKRLIDITKKYRISINKDEFLIWPHVPQYGYRMDLGMEVTKNNLENNDFAKDVNDVVDFAKEKDIVLTLMWGAVFFFEQEETATLSFFTTFADKKRQKIKQNHRLEVKRFRAHG